jgi:hypothetical protein
MPDTTTDDSRAIWRRRLLLLATLPAVAFAVSCTHASTGFASRPPTSSVESTTSPATTPRQRPRAIDLRGKDPCAIPQADWPQFGIEEPGKRGEHPDFKSPDCYYIATGDVALVVTAGTTIWTEARYNAEIKPVARIDGFPTITVASNVDRRACWAVVDVADGQFLMTTATPDPGDPSKPDRCQLAYLMAESAMKTLTTS